MRRSGPLLCRLGSMLVLRSILVCMLAVCLALAVVTARNYRPPTEQPPKPASHALQASLPAQAAVATGSATSAPLAAAAATPTASVALATPVAGQVARVANQPAAPVPAATATATALSPPNASAAQPALYTVVLGDGLYALAAQFGVPEATLAAANGLAPTAQLAVGQQLIIPTPAGK